MQKGTLFKVETHEDAEIPNHNGDGIRTGYFNDMPEVGCSFMLFDDEKMGRALRTSYIHKILERSDTEITFKTNNSIYKLLIG
jgi:hypothetical protein